MSKESQRSEPERSTEAARAHTSLIKFGLRSQLLLRYVVLLACAINCLLFPFQLAFDGAVTRELHPRLWVLLVSMDCILCTSVPAPTVALGIITRACIGAAGSDGRFFLRAGVDVAYRLIVPASDSADHEDGDKSCCHVARRYATSTIDGLVFDVIARLPWDTLFGAPGVQFSGGHLSRLMLIRRAQVLVATDSGGGASRHRAPGAYSRIRFARLFMLPLARQVGCTSRRAPAC